VLDDDVYTLANALHVAHSDADAHALADAYAHGDTYRDANANRSAHRHPNTDRQPHTIAFANTDTGAGQPGRHRLRQRSDRERLDPADPLCGRSGD
jgi:hypothetical protein